jgi:hypothetical protein
LAAFDRRAGFAFVRHFSDRLQADFCNMSLRARRERLKENGVATVNTPLAMSPETANDLCRSSEVRAGWLRPTRPANKNASTELSQWNRRFLDSRGENIMARNSRSGSDDVKGAMKRRKAGTLKSGGSGKTAKSKKQAIAIGLSEARAKGKKIPSEKSA